MEQELLKQILTRLDGIDSRLDGIETQQAENSKLLHARLDGIETQQAEDSKLLRIIFDHSIDITERVTGHDLVFDALQNVLEERKQSGDAAF